MKKKNKKNQNQNEQTISLMNYSGKDDFHETDSKLLTHEDGNTGNILITFTVFCKTAS